ncbi:unnamed protein product, partial [Laminaria digitata]
GSKAWLSVSLDVPNRSALQCCNRWNNKRLTEASPLDELQEPKKIQAVDYFREVEWAEVVKLMASDRTEAQCRAKWFELMDPCVNRSRIWSAEEDARLRKGEWDLLFSLPPSR